MKETKLEWFKPEERLPDDGEQILLYYCPEYIIFGTYYDDGAEKVWYDWSEEDTPVPEYWALPTHP